VRFTYRVSCLVQYFDLMWFFMVGLASAFDTLGSLAYGRCACRMGGHAQSLQNCNNQVAQRPLLCHPPVTLQLKAVPTPVGSPAYLVLLVCLVPVPVVGLLLETSWLAGDCDMFRKRLWRHNGTTMLPSACAASPASCIAWQEAACWLREPTSCVCAVQARATASRWTCGLLPA
jgi:hypothetical protein